MNTSDILIPLGGGDDEIGLLVYGANLAARLGGTITAYLMQPDPLETLALAGDPGFALFSPTVLDGMKAGLRDLAVATEARVKAHPGMVFETAIGLPEGLLPRRASLIDFAIVSCPCARNQGLMSGTCETLLMEARVPVLVARTAPDGLAVVAWDGGPESGRALRRAIPLLEKASAIQLVQVTRPLKRSAARYTEPERALAFLQRYGLSAETVLLPETDHEAGAILAHAKTAGAGLLVSGAYGHSRLQQFVFGGSTRDFLGAKDSPSLFMVH